jgi:hypothetical protein
METIPTAYYDSVPVPKKEDYKMLRNIVWSQESNNTEDSYMVIRGTKSLEILATETYDVTVYLKDFKE